MSFLASIDIRSDKLSDIEKSNSSDSSSHFDYYIISDSSDEI